MSNNSNQTQLRCDLRRVFRSMDFVSRHPALKRGGSDAPVARWVTANFLVGGLMRRGRRVHPLATRRRRHPNDFHDIVRPYGHFVSELLRKLLKKFPVMLQFDKRRRFTGLVIFKPNRKSR
jgi:hypothetical protein